MSGRTSRITISFVICLDSVYYITVPEYRIPRVNPVYGDHRVLKPHIGVKVRCGSWTIIPTVSWVNARKVWRRKV